MYIPVQSDWKEVRYERTKVSSPYAPASIGKVLSADVVALRVNLPLGMTCSRESRIERCSWITWLSSQYTNDFSSLT